MDRASLFGRASSWDASLLPSCSHAGESAGGGCSPSATVAGGRRRGAAASWVTSSSLRANNAFLRWPNHFFRLLNQEDAVLFRAIATTTTRTGRHPPQARTRAALTARGPDVATDGPENLDKEPHKFFDQVVITVRAGDGGNGAVFNMPKPKAPPERGTAAAARKKKTKKTAPLKRAPDGTVLLPMGGHGGDVVLYADQNVSSLLEFHRKRRHNAKRGSNVDTMGKEITSLVQDGVSAPVLRIPVPVGTVVKKKRGSKLLADLILPGDEIRVARGGHGGLSILEIPKTNRTHLRPSNILTMSDPEDKALTLGTQGEEISLELTMRVVADLGLVGLPNAGKSSLLAAITRAKPDIAAYPFTTLMPNLGLMPGDPEKEDGGLAMGATVADLPGLIKDAHLGKGLGRMFLRHLRRTKLLIHIVDAAAPDPIEDYTVLREELRMYNPEYVRRPHIVVLNKLDLPEAQEKFQGLRDVILGLRFSTTNAPVSESKSEGSSGTTMQALPVLHPDLIASSPDGVRPEEYPPPIAVLGISARDGMGVDDFLKRVRQALREDGLELRRKERPEPRYLYKQPSWRL